MNYSYLYITSQPGYIHHKWAWIDYVTIHNEKYTVSELLESGITLYDVFDSLDEVFARIDEEPGKTRPYPDFLSVNVHLAAINEKVEKVFNKLQVPYRTKKITFTNKSETVYKLVYFPCLPLLDMKKNHVKIVKKRTIYEVKTQTDTPLVLNSNIKFITHIARVKEIPTLCVCTEEVKNEIKKEKLIGIRFEGIKTTT